MSKTFKRGSVLPPFLIECLDMFTLENKKAVPGIETSCHHEPVEGCRSWFDKLTMKKFLETFFAPSFVVEKGIEKTHNAVEGTIGKALTELLLW